MKLKISIITASIIAILGCGGDSSSSHSKDGDEDSSHYTQRDDNDNERYESENEEEHNNNQNGGQNQINKGEYTLLAWNDLGMHCIDGKDYSVFSILPPYNNLHAQLKDRSGDLITSGVTITYEATLGVDGKWNTNSIETETGEAKTNFWSYTKPLFGVDLEPNIGLTGNKTPTKEPQKLLFNSKYNWWEAEGIPITPYNDDGTKNYYPLVKVMAKDSNGNILASVETVLPVSDELDCKRCHSSSSKLDDAKPKRGWVNYSDIEKDYKFNILRLHDEKNPNAVREHLTQLQAKGYNYNPDGLETTALNGTPILCVACHKSNALPNIGIELEQLTTAIHSKHAEVIDPITDMKLGDSSNRNSCYACHPGESTKCLRGVMGNATDSSGQNAIQCQSCHGDMKSVGKSNRDGWLDQPNCQSCHHNGKRETTAIDPTTNTLRAVVDNQFATNPNTPMVGKSLYRFSTGHGKLQCEACHGSTHAIYPAHKADNLLSNTIQGHIGTISECSSCHNKTPKTASGGPHGLHTIGQTWIEIHGDIAEKGISSCKKCHGIDYRGTFLSETFTDRSFKTEWGTKNFAKGHKIGCYDCHNGPDGEDD